MEWQIFQDKKEDSFNAYTVRTHIHNLEFSVDYEVQPPLFMFEFDSYQVLLYLLLCYVLLCTLIFSILSFY